MAAQEIRVPDIGDFTDVPVIEIHVAPATPWRSRTRCSPWRPTRPPSTCPRRSPGTVGLRVAVGDTVSEGHA